MSEVYPKNKTNTLFQFYKGMMLKMEAWKWKLLSLIQKSQCTQTGRLENVCNFERK